MTFRCMIVLTFTILGASGKPMLNSGFQSNGYSILNGGCGSSLPVINTQVRSGVVETPSIQFPIYTPSTSVSENCQCFKTVVRPQIHNDIITVPTVDRIVRTVTSPVVETYTITSNQVPSQSNNMHSNDRSFSRIYQSNGNNNGACSGSSRGSFSNGQSPSGGYGETSMHIANHDMSHRQIVAQLTSNGGYSGSGSLYSTNSGYSNNGACTTYVLKTSQN